MILTPKNRNYSVIEDMVDEDNKQVTLYYHPFL